MKPSMDSAPLIPDSLLVAHCGLYCGACRAFLRKKCPGCRENVKATWCSIRTCCQTNGRRTCAECADYAQVTDCRHFNSKISKFFGFLFRSDRPACIRQIKEKGLDAHAADMAAHHRQTLPRK